MTYDTTLGAWASGWTAAPSLGRREPGEPAVMPFGGATGDLPRQPVRPDARQRRLTRTHLGDLAGLHDLLFTLRERADIDLAPAYPDFAGKPYPLGRCREIRDAVFERLMQEIQQPRCPTSEALHRFIAAGGVGQKIWGVLRESYFQNAIQLGTLYVDVANDTVVNTKPKVEIRPLHEAEMVPIAGLGHFADIARTYWQAEIYRNSVFPGLAAYYPMICVSSDGGAWLEPGSGQVTELLRRRGLVPSLNFLKAAPAPPADRVRALEGLKRRSSDPLVQAEGDPVAAVEDAIRSRRYEDPAFKSACQASLLTLAGGWTSIRHPTLEQPVAPLIQL